MATGLLVIAFRRATRLLSAIVEHDKTYEATIRLGLSSTTDDAEGEIRRYDAAEGVRALNLATDLQQARQQVEDAIGRDFLGTIEQVPNTFSAIKINGKRAYDLAREGNDVELTARKVVIGEFTVRDVRQGYVGMADATCPLSESADADHAEPVLDVDVRVSCSSGTCIRALARDLGAKLGVGGYLTRLRRTRKSVVMRCPTMPVGVSVPKVDRTCYYGAYRAKNHQIVRGPSPVIGPCSIRRTSRAPNVPAWVLHHALSMLEAARGLYRGRSGEEAVELRFGRHRAGGESGHRSLCSRRCERAGEGRRRGHHRPRQYASGQTDYRVPRAITAWNAACYSGCGAA